VVSWGRELSKAQALKAMFTGAASPSDSSWLVEVRPPPCLPLPFPFPLPLPPSYPPPIPSYEDTQIGTSESLGSCTIHYRHVETHRLSDADLPAPTHPPPPAAALLTLMSALLPCC